MENKPASVVDTTNNLPKNLDLEQRILDLESEKVKLLKELQERNGDTLRLMAKNIELLNKIEAFELWFKELNKLMKLPNF
jgi:hypothetical protein